MLPKAHIVHQIRGRLRLRIKQKRQDTDYFQTLVSTLSSLDGVAEVACNENTGSLLVLHPEFSTERMLSQLETLELFELIDRPEPAEPVMRPVFEGFTRVNRSLREGSEGSIDLRSLAILALLILAVQQLIRGNFIGPALPMLLSALSLAQQIDLSPSDTDAD